MWLYTLDITLALGGVYMFVDVNGIKMYYEKSGSGKPLVMVHCNSMSHKIFKSAVKILEQHFTVYNVDSRGHGKSTRVKEFHYEDMTEDMYQFISKLNIDKPVFYGFSDGGIIGLMLASKYPGLLSHLIVSGASLNPESTKNFPRAFFKLGYFLVRTDKMQLMLREPDITDEMLRKICIPTYVTCGTRDLIKQEHSDHIAEVIPKARLKVFYGESHSSYIAYSKKIAYYILDMLL